MLLRLHTCGERQRIFTRQYRYRRLRKNRSVVEFYRHLMHRAARELATCVNGALMGVQPGKRGQKGRMNIEQAACIVLHEGRRQDAHETGQHDQRGLVSFDAELQGSVKSHA